MTSIDKLAQEVVAARVQVRIAAHYTKHGDLPDVGKVITEEMDAVMLPLYDHLEKAAQTARIGMDGVMRGVTDKEGDG